MRISASKRGPLCLTQRRCVEPPDAVAQARVDCRGSLLLCRVGAVGVARRGKLGAVDHVTGGEAAPWRQREVHSRHSCSGRLMLEVTPTTGRGDEVGLEQGQAAILRRWHARLGMSQLLAAEAEGVFPSSNFQQVLLLMFSGVRALVD